MSAVPASRTLCLLLDAIDREHARARQEALEAEAEERGFDVGAVKFNIERREWMVPGFEAREGET